MARTCLLIKLDKSKVHPDARADYACEHLFPHLMKPREEWPSFGFGTQPGYGGVLLCGLCCGFEDSEEIVFTIAKEG
jgi:hypothetical protein